MLSVIKTAIITIIISFISGVLLDNYKNLAPKISCTMGKCVLIKMNNKKIRAYILKVKNISNKTLHDLTVNVQAHHSELKMDDTKITGGLKFDICGEYNNFNVSIPFLSKNDEFSVKLFVDDIQGEYTKPVVTLRSPENFKKISHGEKNGIFDVLSNNSQKILNLFSKKEEDGIRNPQKNEMQIRENNFLNKKTLITTVSIILLVCFAFLGTGIYKSISEKVQAHTGQSDIEKNSDNTGTTVNKEVNNSNSNTSNNGKSQTSSTKALSKDDNNEVKSKDSSSYSSSKTSDNTSNVNSEDKQSTPTSNTDTNNETSNKQNDATSSSTTNNQNTDKHISNDNVNQNTNTGTSKVTSTSTEADKNNAGNTQTKQPNTSTSSEPNINSASGKQQTSNNESNGN